MRTPCFLALLPPASDALGNEPAPVHNSYHVSCACLLVVCCVLQVEQLITEGLLPLEDVTDAAAQPGQVQAQAVQQ